MGKQELARQNHTTPQGHTQELSYNSFTTSSGLFRDCVHDGITLLLKVYKASKEVIREGWQREQ